MGYFSPRALRACFAFGCTLVLSYGWPRLAQADQTEEQVAEFPVEIHGFVSQGFIASSGSNYLADSKRGSFEFSEVGINFSKQLTERMRVGVQLFTRDLGPLGNYRTRFDWFYLDYRFWDWLGVRAGRTKLPFGLYNESSDIDAARVPVLLPQSVYPVSNRDFLLSQTGSEVYGNLPLGEAGSLEYRLYGGTVFYDTADATAAGTNIKVPYIFGGRLMWQAPLEGLQLGGSVQRLRIDADAALSSQQLTDLKTAGVVAQDFNGPLRLRIPALLGIASLEYTAHDLLFAAEYSRWQVGLQSPVAAFSAPDTASERMYAAAAYHVAPWFTPGVYYSLMYANVDDRGGHEPPHGALPGSAASGHAAYQHDVAMTLRYDLNAFWIVKLEGHYMHGTAGLTSALNDNRLLSSLPKDWVVALLKTTAYF